jgi:hypothetical protein
MTDRKVKKAQQHGDRAKAVASAKKEREAAELGHKKEVEVQTEQNRTEI